MAQYHKRQLSDVIVVEGENLRWHVHREPQQSSVDGTKGLCIAVADAEKPQRQLLLEFPYVYSPNRQGQRPKITNREVAKQVALAMADGWDPGSRGKPFAFQVGLDWNKT